MLFLLICYYTFTVLTYLEVIIRIEVKVQLNPVISKSVVELEVKIALYGHKTFEYEFCTCTPKLPNQDTGDIVYNVLIGCFSSMETKFIEYSFN